MKNSKKGMSVVLAAAILISGGSAAFAMPAQAANTVTTIPAPPSPVKNIITTVTVDTVTARWDAPNPNEKIAYYYVSLVDGDRYPVHETTTTKPEITLGNLNPNTTYTLNLIAMSFTPEGYINFSTNVSLPVITKVGTNVVPAPVVPKLPAASAPKAPTSLAAKSVTKDSAVVSWQKPSAVGTVTTYSVTLKRSGWPDRYYNVAGTQESLQNLTENTSYTVEVAANVIGDNGTKAVSPVAKVSFKTAAAKTSTKVVKTSNNSSKSSSKSSNASTSSKTSSQSSKSSQSTKSSTTKVDKKAEASKSYKSSKKRK